MIAAVMALFMHCFLFIVQMYQSDSELALWIAM